MLLKQKNKLKSEKLKEQIELQRQKPCFIIRFLDPYENYSLYGDMILPNVFWHNRNEFVYPAELFLNYKSIRQVHVRPNGIIIEFEDFDENARSNISFLRDRLYSLGDQEACNLANFLLFYGQNFESGIVPKHLSNFQKKGVTEKGVSMFDWIDQLFEENKENLVAIRGNKFVSTKDFSAKILCFNNKLLEWISSEKNPFSQNLITDCCRLIFFRDLEEFTNLIKYFLIKDFIFGLHDKPLPLSIKTMIGVVNIMVRNYAMFFPDDGMYLQYWIHEKNYFDPNTLEALKKTTALCQSWEKGEVRKTQSQVESYSNLMKTYYLKNEEGKEEEPSRKKFKKFKK